ncbi:uncharacterized protein [Physcomitrium patens]|nr:uncharacterized protein LOC112290180 isoform X1 [Physcomitrium patens]|eukprot:XP_024391971.1 uncharacterized protein LOC112290180 isoform X1 [Physcomitrella patens]
MHGATRTEAKKAADAAQRHWRTPRPHLSHFSHHPLDGDGGRERACGDCIADCLPRSRHISAGLWLTAAINRDVARPLTPHPLCPVFASPPAALGRSSFSRWCLYPSSLSYNCSVCCWIPRCWGFQMVGARVGRSGRLSAALVNSFNHHVETRFCCLGRLMSCKFSFKSLFVHSCS